MTDLVKHAVSAIATFIMRYRIVELEQTGVKKMWVSKVKKAARLSIFFSKFYSFLKHAPFPGGIITSDEPKLPIFDPHKRVENEDRIEG